ncbi:MAG: hypothetical protein L3J39_06855 [Verrucomicrobiales bacterium]|nr:hypothetical protein [Verrucomicrobiales bacterium]
MIITSDTQQHHSQLGGKAGALAKLAGAGFNIPSWFAVTADNDLNQKHLTEQVEKLGGECFAVRSSARGEDGVEHSFAGQYDSFLFVDSDSLEEKIRQVWDSHQSTHLEVYQKTKNIAVDQAPTALVQKMVEPEVSGVAFSADPVTGRRSHAMVAALWGVGSAVVSGECDADTWLIDLQGEVVDRTLADKTHHHQRSLKSHEGVCLVETKEEKRHPACLDLQQIAAVARLSRQCASHFDCPQDIEWAIESGQLYLLQSRPITTLTHTPDPDDPLTVWDNSNIAESYSGITSPLTFSFAERIYEHVYREFCILLSVPQQRVADNDQVFSQMLGHIQGHVYYNLNSWYQVLAMLPGFSINRSFMEQMMGVKEPIPAEVVEEILAKTRTSKFKDGWSLLRTAIGLFNNNRGLQKQIDGFYLRLNTALAALDKPLSQMSGVELAAHYRELESQLLKRWDAPLVNDFFAMIYFGVLKSLCEKWLGDGSLQNSLLLDAGEIISAEPPRRINAMAKEVAKHKSLAHILANIEITAKEKLILLQKYANIFQLYQDYLEEFGDRCLEELKLESPTVGDNPQSLLIGIGVLAKRFCRLADAPGEKTNVEISHVEIPEVNFEALTPIKRKVFDWILHQTKNRVRDRENLRFERTRLFGRVRQIVLSLGKRLFEEGLIDESGDVFYLKICEVMGVYENKKPTQKLRALVASRKQQQSSFVAAPPDRFETRGPLHRYTSFSSTTSEKEVAQNTNQLSGTGACPGVTQGTVRVVNDPRKAILQEGEILVAQQTDPGWVVLFPAASGLLVERGSLLSHSAIVARELRLPCIVSIPHITTILKTGDLVEMDGSKGTVHILKRAVDQTACDKNQIDNFCNEI